MKFPTYENRAIIADQKWKSRENVYSWRRNFISDWNCAVAFVRSERIERVWNRRISKAIDWDSDQGHAQQHRQNRSHVCLRILAKKTTC